jgi:hypothetical protein
MGLSGFDKQAAERCFDENRLSKEGNDVARYWLSLWRDDRLPARADFQPKKIAPHLRALALFDVVPDRSVHCRLMGSGLAQGMGKDLTGLDWIALTKPEDRAVRLERWSTVARGAVGRGLRPSRRESGDIQFSEEIMLPFGDIAGDGSHQVLLHVSWRQTDYNPTLTGVSHANALSIEFRLTPLRRLRVEPPPPFH